MPAKNIDNLPMRDNLERRNQICLEWLAINGFVATTSVNEYQLSQELAKDRPTLNVIASFDDQRGLIMINANQLKHLYTASINFKELRPNKSQHCRVIRSRQDEVDQVSELSLLRQFNKCGFTMVKPSASSRQWSMTSLPYQQDCYYIRPKLSFFDVSDQINPSEHALRKRRRTKKSSDDAATSSTPSSKQIKSDSTDDLSKTSHSPITSHEDESVSSHDSQKATEPTFDELFPLDRTLLMRDDWFFQQAISGEWIQYPSTDDTTVGLPAEVTLASSDSVTMDPTPTLDQLFPLSCVGTLFNSSSMRLANQGHRTDEALSDDNCSSWSEVEDLMRMNSKS